MSHRTQDLPPLTGLAHTVRELRYHEVARQILAVVLILLYALTTRRPIPVLVAIGIPLALLGTLVRLYASGFIIKNQQLATHGPYKHVRHPLYTGNILLVVGFAIANSQWWPLPLAAFFFWFYYPPAIEYEDRKLHRIFGTAWEQWSARTPALMPKLGGSGSTSVGSNWSLTTSMRQNGELFLVVFCVLCMAWVVWRTL